MKTLSSAHSLMAVVAVLAASTVSLSLTAQTTSVPRRSYNADQATLGVVIPANTHTYLRCPANTRTPLVQNAEISVIRAWAYEYTGSEPPFRGKYWFTDAQLAKYPKYAKLNTLNEVIGEKRYYFATQKPLYFRCGEGISIPRPSAPTSSMPPMVSSTSSAMSRPPSSSSTSSRPVNYCSDTVPCQSGMRCINNTCYFVDDCSSGFGQCSSSSSFSIPVFPSSSSSSYPYGYCSDVVPCPAGQTCIGNRCAFVDDCASGFGFCPPSSRSSSSSSVAIPECSPPVCTLGLPSGCEWGTPQYDARGCQVSCPPVICKSSSSSSVPQGPEPVVAQPPYKIGVNYHATTADFLATDTTGPFLQKYHVPEVRAEVRRQLQILADEGANVIKTAIWFVEDPAKRTTMNWRFAFPPTQQELANVNQYAKDVAAIQSVRGLPLELTFSIGFLGCADYRKENPDGTFGWCAQSWDQIIEKTKASMGGLADAVKDVKRPDGKLVTSKIYLEGEVMIEAKANQEEFLLEMYPWFIERMKNTGITATVYFLVANKPTEIFDDAFKDPKYPELSGHRSLYWVYRSTKFLEDNNLPVPDQLDFSSYLERTATTSYADMIRRIWQDLAVLYPGKPIGVVETLYPMEESDRRDLANAYVKEAHSTGKLRELIFWTTPDGASYEGGRPRVSVAWPLDLDDYKANSVGVNNITCPVAITAASTCSGTVSWRSLHTGTVQVWVRMDKNPLKLLACGNNTSKNINWLIPGRTYKFYLQTAQTCSSTTPLSTLDIRKVEVGR